MSAHRRHAARRILSHISVSIVRGNSSEIRTLANLFGYPVEKEQHGVDAVSMQMPDAHASSNSISERLRTDTRIARFLSKRLAGCYRLYGSLRSGCLRVLKPPASTTAARELAQITGSGCMMDGLLAAFAAASKSYFYPAVCAVTEIGLCGENAAAQMQCKRHRSWKFPHLFHGGCRLMTGEQLQGGQKLKIPTK